MIPTACPQNPNLPRDTLLCLANIDRKTVPCLQCEVAKAIAAERAARKRRGYVRSAK
jgi:hypothetical protein